MGTSHDRPWWIATTTYIMSLTASIVLIMLPTISMEEGWGFFVQLAFHLFLGIGSVIALVGAFTRRSAIEAMGIPLIGTAVFAYGTLLILVSVAGETNSPGAASGIGFIMMSLVCGLSGRLWECFSRVSASVSLHDGGSDD